MNRVTSLLFGLSFLVAISNPSAQGLLNEKSTFPSGISLEYGIGSYAHTDEYISKERYSGPLPYFGAGWTSDHENYVYRIGMEFRYSSEIKNYNVSAEVYQFSLNQDFLYPLPEFSLLSRKAYAYVGPSAEVFAYANKQNIAVTGFDYSQSVAALLSLGLSSELLYPLSGSFNMQSSLKFSLLSLGIRMVDVEETDESPMKLLTLLSGVNGSFRLGIRYYLLRKLSVSVEYLLHITRISSWDPLLSASDNLILGVTYGF
jgi:hypothetical protein